MKKILIVLVLSIVLSSTNLVIIANSSAPKNQSVFVDSGITFYVGGSGEGNYSRIQDAMDNASEGDTVYVYSGNYQENIKISKSIRLIGESNNNVIINGNNKTDTISITTANVMVSNFTIRNSGNFDAGIKINTNNNIVENCKITNCYDGIELNKAWYNQISKCEIANNMWAGIGIFQSYNNTIDQCRIYCNLKGMHILHSGLNIIQRCNIFSNAEEGCQLEEISIRNVFYQNEISSNKGYGLFVYWGSDETYISHCKITNNGIGIMIGSIFRDGANGTTILANDIIDNNGPGISFLGDGVLSRNTHIHFNNIYNNNLGISAKTASHCFIYAQNNWWGSKRGPIVFGLRSGEHIGFNLLNSHIFFHPWLKVPAVTFQNESLDVFFKCDINPSKMNDSIGNSETVSKFSSWYNNTFYVGGSGEGNYSRIQDAMDNASEGDTVYVYSGNYQENIKISKSIRLIGESNNNVIINGNNKTDTISITTANVMVSNFTIRNSGNFDAGIKINTNNNIVENCKITNCYDGIELNKAWYNQISKCEIADNEREGIYLLYSHYNNITDCSLPNNFESLWFDSSDYNRIVKCLVESNKEEGVQIKDSSHNEFVSCVFSSNIFGYGIYIERNSDKNIMDHCEISLNGVGIFFSSSEYEGPDGSTVSFCNIINNYGTGIFFLGNGTLMNDTQIHFNNVYGNKKGLISINANGCFVNAQNNWWGSKRGPSILGIKSGDRIGWDPLNGRIYFYPWTLSPLDA